MSNRHAISFEATTSPFQQRRSASKRSLRFGRSVDKRSGKKDKCNFLFASLAFRLQTRLGFFVEFVEYFDEMVESTSKSRTRLGQRGEHHQEYEHAL
jgi:hypothetical protein